MNPAVSPPASTRESQRLGATLTLSEDVLFATHSDRLRPGAIEKLR